MCNFSNCIVIGANAVATGDNTITLGNESLRNNVVTTEVLAPDTSILIKVGDQQYKLLARLV